MCSFFDSFGWNRARVGTDQLAGVVPFPVRNGVGANTAMACRWLPCIVDSAMPTIRGHRRSGDAMLYKDAKPNLLDHANFILQTQMCPDMGKFFFLESIPGLNLCILSKTKCVVYMRVSTEVCLFYLTISLPDLKLLFLP